MLLIPEGVLLTLTRPRRVRPVRPVRIRLGHQRLRDRQLVAERVQHERARRERLAVQRVRPSDRRRVEQPVGGQQSALSEIRHPRRGDRTGRHRRSTDRTEPQELATAPPVTSDSRRPKAHESFPSCSPFCIGETARKPTKPCRPGRYVRIWFAFALRLTMSAIASVEIHYAPTPTGRQLGRTDSTTRPTSGPSRSVARPTTRGIHYSAPSETHAACSIRMPASAARRSRRVEKNRDELQKLQSGAATALTNRRRTAPASALACVGSSASAT